MFEGGIIKSFFTWVFKRLALIEDENKVVREVIFNLLDVWHYSNTYKNIYGNISKNIDTAIELAIGKMPLEAFQGASEDEIAQGKILIKNAIEQQLAPILIPQVIAKITPLFNQLEERYTTAVNKLATIHPARAYYLQNQVNLLPLLEDVINLTRSAGRESGLSIEQEKYYLMGVDGFSNPMKSQLLQNQINDLEHHIKELAKLDSNKQSRDDVLNVLNSKQNNNDDDEFKKFLQPTIDEAMKSIQSQLQNKDNG